jgi:MOSC domain-containing protein YiiM
MTHEGASRSPSGLLYQINVSQGGVPKLPVEQARVTSSGLEGDRQRNRTVHGGPERALCLYAKEIVEALQREGHSIVPGAAGENLTLAGLVWQVIGPGVRLRIGKDVVIEVTGYCEPCRHNARWFVNGQYRRMDQDRYPGWSRLYSKVLHGGWIHRGDPVEVVARST